MNINDLSSIIRQRRAIYPKTYDHNRTIERELLEVLLENANHAPTHKRTEPWRFRVFHTEASRAALGDYLSDFYRKNTPAELFSEEKMKKSGENPRLAGAVIAIIMQREPTESLPEWEEQAAVAMAVQNMWLSCTAIGLGCYWSTPKAALEPFDLLQLKPGEKPLGLLYIGWPIPSMPVIPAQRRPVSEKTIWI
ncbi:MAG: nitroreductase [Saprospiraceae bacterium]|nr:nitroreductase [Saprospiraceae bacterium]